MSNYEYDKLNCALNYIRSVTDFKPVLGVVLGSGLGSFGEVLKEPIEIPYIDIPGFPVSTVSGHDGKYILGYVGEIPVICMKGRVHYYEGYTMNQVVMPIRLMGLMGISALILTNAAGGCRKTMQAGDFMLIKDQITSFVPSPLIGKNIDEIGTRFPDMSDVYDSELSECIRKAATASDISLHEGTYLQLTGPQYETPSEIRMFTLLGADAVGMSTAVEAMCASHMGIKCCGISFISNPAAGLSENKLNHREVKENADRAAIKFKMLLEKSIINIGEII